MLRNYLKIACRNLRRHKGLSFINIAGFSVGIACCLLLLLWIQDELSYDRYHDKAERIYRVIVQYESNGKLKRSATTSAPLGQALFNEFPEVEKAVRFGENGFLVSSENKCFPEKVFFADPGVFDVFNFSLVQGNPKTALKTPYSIIISENAWEKYFGKKDPLGKVINLKNMHDFKVTGVFKNIPENSHFRFDFLGSFLDYAGKDRDKWNVSNYYTYILVSKGQSISKFKAKLPLFIKNHLGVEAVSVYKKKLLLQPLASIHLHSHLANEIEPNNDIRNIYIFSAIALFILLIACLNYINISTALNITRVRDIGLRKVFGAFPSQLIYQYICEASLLSFISLPFTVLLARIFLPLFNSISGKQIVILLFGHSFILITVLIVTFFFVGIISGIFPAFFVLFLSPVKALKGIFGEGISGLRKFLVVFQFTVSIIFIISTVVIFNQLTYIKNRDLGFIKEHIVNIPIYSQIARDKYETIKEDLISNAYIKAVSASTFSPEKNIWYVNYWYEGIQDDKNPMISCIIVDEDFLETFGIKISKGRNFSKPYAGSLENSYILNETAVKEIGWESAVGKKFKLGFEKTGTVIGVVEDFHFRSLHHEIGPIALSYSPQWFTYFSVRISPNNIPQTLVFLKNQWQKLIPNQPFEYSFLDDDINNLYRTERNLGRLFAASTSLAIFIACLGVFGMIIFTSRQRIKEIGIRKVLGASVTKIVLLLSGDFTRWILMANIFAWPIAWYIMNKWLQNYAYRVDIGLWIFPLSGIIVLAIAFMTISYKSFKSASLNPIEALRYE